jgi:SAM-dependent methyltransferase
MSDAIDPPVVTGYENATWSRCAESYAETFHMLTGLGLPLLVKAAGIAPGRDVLDLGSGPGESTAMMAATGAQVTGVDFSKPMIETARRRHPTLRFHEGDVEVLPFGDRTYDAVVANCVVHHLARPLRVFEEVTRVLRPGGLFAFTVWGSLEEQTGFGVFFEAVQAHHSLAALPHGPLFGVIDQAVYEPLIIAAGLTDLRLDRHPIAWRTATLDPVLRGLWDWGNVAALPNDVQERIRSTTSANAERYRQDDGFVFPHSILLGLAARP